MGHSSPSRRLSPTSCRDCSLQNTKNTIPSLDLHNVFINVPCSKRVTVSKKSESLVLGPPTPASANTVVQHDTLNVVLSLCFSETAVTSTPGVGHSLNDLNSCSFSPLQSPSTTHWPQTDRWNVQVLANVAVQFLSLCIALFLRMFLLQLFF